MKRILLTLAALLVGFAPLKAQVPQGISYQAVLVDKNGQPMPGYDVAGLAIPDAAFTLSFRIYSTNPTAGGVLLYAEEHLTKLSDEFGMYDAIIGLGTKLPSSSLDFDDIPWRNGQQKWLEVVCDLTEKNVRATTIQPLWTVPYAFAADHAVSSDLATDVVNNDDADADPTNEIQSISITGTVITLSNGGGAVTLPVDPDSDPTNEIQALTRVKDSVYLSNGGGVFIGDTSHTNELQVLSIVNDQLTITQGNTITIPTSIGPNGLSAYEIWLANGNTGTQSVFLNSLIGPIGLPGVPGLQGAPGIPGIPGPVGQSGRTLLSGAGAPTSAVPAAPLAGDFYLDLSSYLLYGPYNIGWGTGVSLIGPNGPMGGTGQTGAAGAPGAPGATGAPGKSILTGTGAPGSGVLANMGDLYLDLNTYTLYGPFNGSWATSRSLIGPVGPMGAAGQTGATGAAGATGATGATGAIGAAGAAGPIGPTGPGILSGAIAGATPNSTVGLTGEFFLDSDTYTLWGPKSSTGWPTNGVSLVGPAGPMGLTGATGSTGLTGATGAPGATGPAGAVGTTGPTGPAGLNGRSIFNGVGAPINTTAVTLGAQMNDFYLDILTYELYGPYTGNSANPFFGWRGGTSLVGPTGPIGPLGPAGPAGADGAAGPMGPAGAIGATGAMGLTGPSGPAGAAGPNGPIGPTGLTGASGPAGAMGPIGLTGPMGPMGPMGLTGLSGPAGAAGPTGPIGPTGLTGASGPAGATGPMGPIGPAGATGAAGPIGPAGAVGATGATGATGAAGATGPIGPQGLIGNRGATIWNGSGVPSPTYTGAVQGDFYMDVVGNMLYGPYVPASTSLGSQPSWGGGLSVVGPVGPTGPVGPAYTPPVPTISSHTVSSSSSNLGSVISGQTVTVEFKVDAASNVGNTGNITFAIGGTTVSNGRIFTMSNVGIRLTTGSTMALGLSGGETFKYFSYEIPVSTSGTLTAVVGGSDVLNDVIITKD